MEDQEQVHSHYWPGKDCIPITPQAVRFGYVFPVYVTRTVWHSCITWTQGRNQTADGRIYALLESAWHGMGKALTSEPDRVWYQFKHWFWNHKKPKAKKQAKLKLGARLLLDPETEEPWMLIFHPGDNDGVLTYGEPEENREDDRVPGEEGQADGPEMDPGVREAEDASEWGAT